MSQLKREWKTRVRQSAYRSVEDRRAIYDILDAGFAGIVALVDEGRPYAVPMAYWRDGDAIYVHAHRKSRIARILRTGGDIAFTVMFLDGLVMARSAFSHSMNYRSVMVGGTPEEIVDPEGKAAAFRAVVEWFAKGRWEECRQPNEQEFKATSVFRLSLENAVAKVRTGPPKDDEADLDYPCWAGVMDAHTAWAEPKAFDEAAKGFPAPKFRI